MASTQATRIAQHRCDHVPLFNDNKLKLGVFSMNCSGGMIISQMPSSWTIDWDYHLQLAQKADRLGFEAYIPVARWRGVGGPTNFLGVNYETFTYASAIAASTEKIMTFATVHAPIVHPIVAAKMGATIDHVSGGRFGMNVVMGWLTPEFDMFGVMQRDHESRYLYGSEWMEVVDRLWRDSEHFDYDGKFLQLKDLQAEPKPIQPRPVVVNAGNSPTGAAWAARHADFNFGSFADLEVARNYVREVKRRAHEHYDRDIGILTYGLVICRDTEQEARDVHRRMIETADWEAAHNWMSVLGLQSGSFNEQMRGPLAEQFVAGAGAATILGSPEQVARQLGQISETGMEGVMLGFLNWNEELEYFGLHVLPLLQQMGLRGANVTFSSGSLKGDSWPTTSS